MSLSAAVSRELPYLRRYARALTGTTESGDRYVAALLEALIADPSQLHSGSSERVSLYRTFAAIWNSVPVNGESESALGHIADRRLADIMPKPRQAFLLTTMEGFSPSEAAAILSISTAELDDLIVEAGRQIAEQVQTDILIIEDEPLIAMDLESLVERLGHNVVGNARTHREAVEMFGQTKPGLVLADIHLADGSSGLDAVNEILQKFTVPVVFITAYPERLLTGQKPEPAFLINKPYDESVVKAVISQILFFDTKAKLAA
jgi:CheY-like chemotaxis protein